MNAGTSDPLVPFRMLIRLEFPLHRMDPPPKVDGRLDEWTERYLLPPTYRIDGQAGFGLVWMAWHETGLYVACKVRGKRSRPDCNPRWFWRSDNLRIMTDMRDTKDAHRASRFCQQFYFMPAGSGPGRRSCPGRNRPLRSRRASGKEEG